MRKLVFGLAAAVALSVCAQIASAADNNKISGVLIDDHCAPGMMKKADPEKAAAKHPVSCDIKCQKNGSNYVLITGDKQRKLDKHGQELAQEYLAKTNAKTKVTITGDITADEIKVESIKPAAAEG